MRYMKTFPRRVWLRGAGTVCVGLPFLDEMRTQSVYSQAEEPPNRVLSLFIGGGLASQYMDQHLADYSGPFTPLAAFREKLSFIRHIDYPDGGLGEAHSSGGISALNGTLATYADRTTGPSIDQVLASAWYGETAPGYVATLAGTLGVRYRVLRTDYRRIKSWTSRGNPAAIPSYNPAALFDAAFGKSLEFGNDPDAARAVALRRSILDQLSDQYKYYTSDASRLSGHSRARLKDHFDQIRELERRSHNPEPGLGLCPGAKAPAPADLPYNQVTNQTEPLVIETETLREFWRQMAEVMVVALRCGQTRVVSACYMTVGDHFALLGEGFDDTADGLRLIGKPSTNHEWSHQSEPGAPGDEMWKKHIGFSMSQVATLLAMLDDPSYPDANGGTLLDNIALIAGTEASQDGHLPTDVFHFIGKGGGRFHTNVQTGGTPAAHLLCADLYNTVLQAYGIQKEMASREYRALGRSFTPLDALRRV